ncbi:MAG: PepSY-associated TM helix domain-containing protein [Solirubrobacteraceae bacterium]
MATIEDTTPVDDIPFVSDQIAEQDQHDRAESTDPARRRRARRSKLLRPILWRLHFIGGFLAGPVVLSLAVTGILYAWHPQIDGLRFGDAMTPSSGQVQVSLAGQVAAAQATHPDWGVHSVIPGHAVAGSNDLNTAVVMDPPGGEDGFSAPADAVDVYVDQATGKVTGEVEETNLSDTVFRGLHSNWLLGDDARPLTELAGSWFLVSLFIGLYLWWPGLRRRGAAAFTFRRRITGRRQSKDWHNFIGLAILVPMLFVAITGLTWTKYAGGARYETIKKDVVAPPASGFADTALKTAAPGSSALVNIDKVDQRAVEAKLPAPYRITLPANDKTAWKANSERQRYPINRDEIAVDGATGAVTSRFDYSSEHWFNKISTAGISFHQAQLFGVATQVFMTLLAIGVLAVVVFGYRMWWQRRPRGGMGAPPPIRSWLRNAPLTLLAIIVVLAWLLPTLALSLLVWLVIERAMLWWQIARGRHRGSAAISRMAKQGAPLRSGVEMYKAAGVATIGLFMVAAPGLGTPQEEWGVAGTMNLLAWAWTRPLGVVFLACGAIGMYAMLMTSGKGERDKDAVKA